MHNINNKMLPNEMWFQIFLHLEPEDLVRFRLVSRLFNSLSLNDTIIRSVMSRHFHTIDDPAKTLNTYLNIKNGHYKKYLTPYKGSNYNKFLLLNGKYNNSALILEYATNDIIHFNLKSAECHKIHQSIDLNVHGSIILTIDVNNNLSIYDINLGNDGLFSTSQLIIQFKLDFDERFIHSRMYDKKLLIVCTNYCYLIKNDVITKICPDIYYNYGCFFGDLIFITDYYGDTFQLYDMNGIPFDNGVISTIKKDLTVIDNYKNKLLCVDRDKNLLALDLLYHDGKRIGINRTNIKVTNHLYSSFVSDQYLIINDDEDLYLYTLKSHQLLWKINDDTAYGNYYFNGTFFVGENFDYDYPTYDIYDFS